MAIRPAVAEPRAVEGVGASQPCAGFEPEVGCDLLGETALIKPRDLGYGKGDAVAVRAVLYRSVELVA